MNRGNIVMELIREEGYADTMNMSVLPYLKARRKIGDFERIAGQKIHYRIYTADRPHADLVLVHGFTEGIDKFNEVVYYFLQEGFNIWQIQQRGHGRSYRLVKDPSLVHLNSYSDLLEDLHYFVAEIVEKTRKDPALPKYYFGHSMGGGVGAAYIEKWPDDFRKAVLSSPMLELDSGNIPTAAASLFARFMIMRGKGADYMPGSSSFSTTPDFENSCSNCRERFDYWFRQACEHREYQTSGSSINTALEFLRLTKYATDPKNCKKVKARVLLVQAGLDHMVKPGGQETFIRQIGSLGRLLRIDSARHEIYMCRNSEQKKYWDEVLKFLNS